MEKLSAVVLGYTGLTGGELVKQLLDDNQFSMVTILVRKPVLITHPKLKVLVTDFNNLVEFRKNIGVGNCLFCCIGTTQSKVKGNKDAYRKVDVDIPVNAAKIAKDAGFTCYLLVSAVGANIHSSNFYLKLKGEVEKEIAALNFHAFHTFRPSFLLGERQEVRLGEMMAKGAIKALSFLLFGSFQKYKGIYAKDVAKAMVSASKSNIEGMVVHHYADMMKCT